MSHPGKLEKLVTEKPELLVVTEVTVGWFSQIGMDVVYVKSIVKDCPEASKTHTPGINPPKTAYVSVRHDGLSTPTPYMEDDVTPVMTINGVSVSGLMVRITSSPSFGSQLRGTVVGAFELSTRIAASSVDMLITLPSVSNRTP